jgi:replication fork protection complex subunit Tof1/Swi1
VLTTNRQERDDRIVSLGLHVVRNLLAIKDAVADGHTLGQKEELANLQVGGLDYVRYKLTSIQSVLIVQLKELTYFQLVLTLASCADKTDFNQFNVLVLDILHLVFRSVHVKDLGIDQVQASVALNLQIAD